jgi:hypothetical protein
MDALRIITAGVLAMMLVYMAWRVSGFPRPQRAAVTRCASRAS